MKYYGLISTQICFAYFLESKKETTICTIQITALTDDMASIMAEIKPQADVVEVKMILILWFKVI